MNIDKLEHLVIVGMLQGTLVLALGIKTYLRDQAIPIS